jgi:hypothetical protein
MDINQINDVVFEYIVKMIKDDEDIDIYNIKEDTYEDFICIDLLYDWDDRYDIITEYFGNTSYFEPSMSSFVDMLKLITEMREEYNLETPITLFEGINIHHTCCNMLRHYAYWYINSLGYVDFKLKLKNYVDEDE